MKTLRLLSAAVVCAFWAQGAAAATVQVSAGAPCKSASMLKFTTIGAAVTAVSSTPGSTIYVCPGIYPEQVTITSPLAIKGVAKGQNNAAIIVPPGGGMTLNTSTFTGHNAAAQIVVDGTSDVDISNISVDASGNGLPACTYLMGIFYRNGSGTITHVAARNQVPSGGTCGSGLGIFVQSGDSGNSNVTISNSSVHNYDKNGITANEVGTNVTILNNDILGSGPVNVGQNGIQIGFGAVATVKGNNIANHLYSGETSGDEGHGQDGAAGVLVYASSGNTVQSNVIMNSQFGIAISGDYWFHTGATADNNVVQSNEIMGAQIWDGIDVCGSDNNVKSNTISTADEAGIRIDTYCTAGASTGNIGSGNKISEACAGILDPLAATITAIPISGTFYNVGVNKSTASGCGATATVVSASVKRPMNAIRP